MKIPNDPDHPLHPERLARDADDLDVPADLLAEARRRSVDVAEGPEDPGHLMTQAEWDRYGPKGPVIRFLDAQSGARALPAGVTRLTWSAEFHGGAQTGTLQINHSAETPLSVGYARSIGQFFVDGPAAGTSAHHMVDPRTVVDLLPANVIGYHVGPNGNRGTIGWEQAGYARFTRAEWLTADGLAQIETLAAAMADEAAALSIPDRRLSNAQIATWAANGRRLTDGGRASHHAIGVVLGGTTHTDPDPNYPYDVLDPRITAHRNGEADDMFDDDDRADLKWIRQQLGTAVGAGQKSFAATVAATLGNVQSIVNREASQDAQLKALASSITDTKGAVLAAVAAMPTGGLDDAGRTGLASAIVAELAKAGVGVSTDEVLRAIGTDLLNPAG